MLLKVEPGIDDHRMRGGHQRKLEKGARTDRRGHRAQASRGAMFGMLDARWDLTLRLTGDGRELTMTKVEPPDYAFHLLAPGAAIPVRSIPSAPTG